MSSVEDHVTQRLAAAKLENDPFPHFYVSDIFPPDYYGELLSRLPTDDEFLPLYLPGQSAEAPADRFTIRLDSDETMRLGEGKRAFWGELAGWMLAEPFLNAMAALIYPHLKMRFLGRSAISLRATGSLSRTKTGFFVGPHTDARHKILTLIFYLPEADRFAGFGTSIYRPRAPGFRCAGGPHHKFDGFEKLATAPFRPNSVFGFVKTDTSFHAVEPWSSPDFVRDTMVYGIADAYRPRTADEGI